MPEATSIPGGAEPVPTVSIGEKTAQPSLKRDAAIDLRIGLNMLGEEGRKLLAEYIYIKRQRTTDKTNTTLERTRTNGNQDHYDSSNSTRL